ncbi:MAG: hypothetical protein AB8B58_15240 [Roseobacter sp.]
MRKMLAVVGVMALSAVGVKAEDLRLAVPEALEASGFAQFVTPRFSLKTGVRIARVGPDTSADMAFVPSDAPLFTGLGQGWGLTHNEDPRAVRFLEWLTSDVGTRTIESFTAEDGSRFAIAVAAPKTVAVVAYDGDAVRGESLSLTLCGRCHVISDKNRMNGMGSTPSFAVLRGLQDWDDRFMRFYLLNPHPAFTQIADVSDPFDPSLPSPIVPLEMTQGDLDAILAYVQDIAPADLGAPLHLQ